jgi:hypothetical protein
LTASTHRNIRKPASRDAAAALYAPWHSRNFGQFFADGYDGIIWRHPSGASMKMRDFV